jgi:hypothetical protein
MRPQLLVFGFGPEGHFAGRLVGALERLESGGTLRVADVLMVMRDGATGEVTAVSSGGRRTGAMVAELLEFRLDEDARRRATERALGAETIREVGAALTPGNALAAVLVEHTWADALQDAVSQTHGEALIDDFVEEPSLAELTGELVGAARGIPAHR